MIEYRVVCGSYATLWRHRGHVLEANSKDAALCLAAALDESAAITEACKDVVVQARHVTPWGRPDRVEELVAEATGFVDGLTELGRDGGPAPPTADPPNVSTSARTPEPTTRTA